MPREWAETLFNYLVHGYAPGGMFTSMLANDAHMMVARSHPSNSIQAFKAALGWIAEYAPSEAEGSYEKVEQWLNFNDSRRRAILEKYELIYSEQEEIMLSLKHGSPGVGELCFYFD